MGKKRWLTGMGALAVLGLGILFFWNLYIDQKTQQQQSAELVRQREEAEPYEQEIRVINKQLEEKKTLLLSYLSDTAKVMVGYRMYAPEDVALIEEQANKYGFSPVVVLDCEMDIEQLTSLIRTVAPKGWELMLMGSVNRKEFDETIAGVRRELLQASVSDTGIFLPRNNDYSETIGKKLADNGFQGYTCFSEGVTNGCGEDGLVYFEYWYVQKGDASIADKVALQVSDRKSMILVFDLESMHMETLLEESMTQRLDLLKEYVEDDKMMYASIKQVVDELSHINEVKEKREAEYEEYAAQQQEKIEELKKKIKQIYGR